MKTLSKVIPVLIAFMLIACTSDKVQHSYNKGINIIPLPDEIEHTEGDAFVFDHHVQIICDSITSDITQITNYFNAIVSTSFGFETKLNTNNSRKSIYLQLVNDENMANEAYSLQVSKEQILITAKSYSGLFYGIQSLLQLLPAEVHKTGARINTWSVPAIKISDSPQFKWRGMHLDVCRHYFPVEFIKKYIDLLAYYKMNIFHWHLTEDQGWRIEIKQYPKLTEVGAYRTEGNGEVYGGFYTQDEVKEIVQYAAERYINVVPEIEMPGHSLAALTAYPELSCTGGPFKVRNIWGVEPDVYCAGKEETFTFLENVINEVVELFPYEYVHIGGDESPKERWEECPQCQARIKTEGLNDEHELQSYFIQRMEKYLHTKGRKLIGWDEILEGGLAPDATVMSWRGEAGGIAAANQQHDVVMTPGSHCYLDHYQGDQYAEPLNIGGNTTLEKLYHYKPIPDELREQEANYILGAQGNVWTEYMETPEFVEYMVLPRMLALSEVVWSKPGNKSWNNFIKRLNNHHMRLSYLGYNYHIPMPEGPHNNLRFTDSIELEFTTTRPEIEFVYSLDGSEPTKKSLKYTEPIQLGESKTVKIRSVLPTGQMSMVRTITAQKTDYIPATKTDRLTNGVNTKQINGMFFNADSVKFNTLTEYKQIDSLYMRFTREEPCAVEFTGYIKIDEKGMYTFASRASRVYIDNVALINTEGKTKRIPLTGMIALEPGYHPFRVVFLNNIEKGVNSAWYTPELYVKTNGDFSTIAADKWFIEE